MEDHSCCVCFHHRHVNALLCLTCVVVYSSLYLYICHAWDPSQTNTGHLLRTKPLDATEGGVASGYSVLDSPMLVQAL